MTTKKLVYPIPITSLLTNSIPRKHHFDTWQEYTQPLFQSERLELGWHFPGCLSNILTSSPVKSSWNTLYTRWKKATSSHADQWKDIMRLQSWTQQY